MKKFLQNLIVMFAAIAVLFAGCGGDDPETPEPTKLAVNVYSAEDSSGIAAANIIIYNADNGTAVTRKTTGPDGSFTMEISAGTYYAEVTAQGYYANPVPGGQAVPFTVSSNKTTGKNFYLAPTNQTDIGYVEGNVDPATNGMLVVAEETTTGSSYGAITGPDGYYVIYNLPYGTYELTAYMAGYVTSTPPTVTLSANNTNVNQNISVTTQTGGTVNGSIQFVAIDTPDSVDVSILDHATWRVVPGLTAMAKPGTFTITGLPPGNYTAWASYRNDGMVMDPDKNANGINFSIAGTESKTLDFFVTGAIDITSPTNPSTEVIPVMADSTVPTFVWTKQSSYSSAKEYIIEVRDANNEVIWGGFQGNNINHPQVTDLMVEYNFDGSATTQSLVPGRVYQWRVFADDDASTGIQTLLSVSEIQMGLFTVPEE